MGAVTFTKSTTDLVGRFPTKYIDNKRVVRGTVQMSNSYATGGDTLALTNLDIKEVTLMLVEPNLLSLPGLSLVLAGTATAPKIIAADANNTEVGNGTDLSTRAVVTVWLFGA